MEEENKAISNQPPAAQPADQPQKERANPEMEAVQANMPSDKRSAISDQPVAPPLPPPKKPGPPVPPKPTPPGEPPKKIGSEKKQKSKINFILAVVGGIILLFVIFIVLMVLMMSRAGADNPVMRAFGLDPAGLKAFLLTVVGISFGLLALVFFVLMIIGVFKLVNVKKGDKEARSKGVKMTVFSLTPLIFVIFIWFVLYNFIGNVQISAEQVIAEIVVVEPEDTTELEAPVEITFSAENVARALIFGGLDIESMDWDLDGNGTFETPVGAEPTVTHLYNRRGSYEVALQVGIAGEEAYRNYTKVIVIGEATFDASPATGFAPLEVEFDASDLIPKGFKVASLDWDFDGDGRYELEGPDNLRPDYTFEQIGVYNVHLRVVDQQDNVENYYREIEVTPSDVPLLTAVIDSTPGLTGAIPLQIRFDGSESESVKGKIVSYEWDFGDGGDLQAGKSVSHIFNDPGTYTVTLTVTEDSGKTASSTVTVEAEVVSSIPEAVITTDPEYDEKTEVLSGVLPFAVEFNASDSIDADDDIVEYQWDFDGDGETDQEGKKADYTFEEAGTFDVTLTVTDSEDQSDSTSITVQISEPGVVAIMSADPEEGTAPLTVSFDGSASSTYEGNIVSYEWDFGDGSPKTITGASVSHKYNAVGSYTVALTVLTNKNESAETSQMIYVREIPLRACFNPSRRNGDAPLAVTFDPMCSTGAVSTYTWDFGDGEQSGSRKPAHTFEYPGNYTVILEVADDKNNVSTYSDVIVAEGELTN
ncbi:PKD domain-containing protein [Patescibacteria group bacterium]|nr:PKD domain-containing protein [Patescibacteria group bacterium]MBU1683544.1 PKD domain-containing protein [Patescibacteria group bacterium]MBU1935113.1 PKD domain-containing protein [Patescibacteria group bacterium]